ncbi:MAG TPA: sulfotransferase, partial [Acidimicrobiia bacterium]
MIALVGAPRSGTTWLQTLLASHDAIVSPQETNLFSRYVAPLEERWCYEARGSVAERQQRRFTGLGAVLTAAEFHGEVGHFVDDVLRSIAALKPGATILVEKTPSHSLHVDLVARYVPGARF